MAPDVSTGWKMKRRPNSAYLVIFLTSAVSATDPAASAARTRFEDANVLTHVASHCLAEISPCGKDVRILPQGKIKSEAPKVGLMSNSSVPSDFLVEGKICWLQTVQFLTLNFFSTWFLSFVRGRHCNP